MSPRTFVSLAVLAVATLIAGGVVVVSGALRSDDYRGGQATASDSNEDGTVVATAGGVSITAGELKDAVMHLQHSKELAEKELQGLGEDTGQPNDYLEDRHNLVLKWGDENVALASLIQDHVLHQKATELGYEVTEEELEENMEWARDAYERGELDAYTQDYIESVGEDHYWQSIYPILATRSMAIEKLFDGVAKQVGTNYYDEEPPLWYVFEEGVIADAEITVPESEEHSATIDGVVGFLDDVRETNIAHLRKDQGLPTDP